jgi:pimeloyl-ACP methyl ester carboxylesterase
MTDYGPGLAYLTSSHGQRLAYRKRAGRQPTLLFLPGYASDMDGAKALALDAFAAQHGIAALRFDYSGTGSSGGQFEQKTLDTWLREARAMADELTAGPLILIGSSMGAWLALHLAMEIPDRIRALVGIAAAPDFTEWGFTPEQQSALLRDGRIERPSAYGGDSQVTSRAFWESGQSMLLLDQPIAVECPVRLIHGSADQDVPLRVALRLTEQLRSADIQLNIIKAGGHRLSEPHEMEAIVRTVAALVEPVQ